MTGFEANQISRYVLNFVAVEWKTTYWKLGWSREAQLSTLSCSPAALILPSALVSSYFVNLMTTLYILVFWFFLLTSFWVSLGFGQVSLIFPRVKLSGKGRSILLWSDKLKTALLAQSKVHISYKSLFWKGSEYVVAREGNSLEMDSWEFRTAYLLGTVISIKRFSRKSNKVHSHSTPENQKEGIYTETQ